MLEGREVALFAQTREDKAVALVTAADRAWFWLLIAIIGLPSCLNIKDSIHDFYSNCKSKSEIF
jgi:hypothetical protein